jgi:hypothetical protein
MQKCLSGGSFLPGNPLLSDTDRNKPVEKRGKIMWKKRKKPLVQQISLVLQSRPQIEFTGLTDHFPSIRVDVPPPSYVARSRAMF